MDRSLFPAYQMTNDYIANYSVGAIDNDNRIRALNRAIEDIHRVLGLTCDEQIFSFLYTQDNMFTDLPVDYDEPILLYYQNNNYNIGGQSGWKWQKYTGILQNSGQGSALGYGAGYSLGVYGQKSFSSTNINGKKQLVQLGANVIQGNTINALNSLNLVSATGDATNLAVDNNIFVANGGSISFTIDPTLGNGYAGLLVSGFGLMNVQTAIQNAGIYKFYSFLQSTDISEIQLILSSETGSFTFSASAQQNGQPFVAQQWFKTQYPWNLVNISGTPNSQEITSYEFRYVEGPSFGSVAIPYFRIDDFYLSFPDLMNLVYYSQYKGTSADGLTKKIILDDLTDLPSFMQFFPDFINMVALRAAYILMPQLSSDKDFITMYRRDYLEILKDLGKIYPRKRIVNLGQTLLYRP